MVRCRAILLGLVLVSGIGGPARMDDSLVLPPYLESVVFDIFSDERELAVEVFPPDAPHQPLTAGTVGMEEIRLGQVLRALILRRPAPGRWVLRTSRPSTRVKIQSQQFFLRGVLVAPAGGEPLRHYDQVYVTYQVTEENGSPLKELPGYPLSAELVLVQPGGHRLSLAMDRHPQGSPGVFRTLQRVECYLPGRYETEVLITTRDSTGRRVKIFQDRWSGFWVGSAKSPDTL